MTIASSPVPPTRYPSNLDPTERLIIALDVSSAGDARKIVAQLGDLVQIYKVGMQLYTAEGPEIVRDLVRSGHRVFLDLKYHDIPNTVAAAVREAAKLGVTMLTVHASGGRKMLEAAVEAARASDGETTPGVQLQILAVSVLTSLDQGDLNQVGVPGAVMDQVLRLGLTAKEAGCAGVVSSAQEAKTLRAKVGRDFLIVTPGVRPAGSAHSDQARVVTPAEAIASGASQIVVGRPITAAKDPAAAARSILKELQL